MTSQSNQEEKATSLLAEIQARVDAISPSDYIESDKKYSASVIVGEATDYLKRLYTVYRQMHAEREEACIADIAWADEMAAKFGLDAEGTPEYRESADEAMRRDQAGIKSRQSFGVVQELLRAETLRAFPAIPGEASVLFMQGWQIGYAEKSPQMFAFILGSAFAQHSCGEEHQTH